MRGNRSTATSWVQLFILFCSTANIASRGFIPIPSGLADGMRHIAVRFEMETVVIG